MPHFQGPMSFYRRDQCASFELLVDLVGKGPPTNGPSKPSALMIVGQKSYDKGSVGNLTWSNTLLK